MPDPTFPPNGKTLPAYLGIGLVVALLGGAFAYTAGWLSPQRLTPERIVGALKPASGAALGRRRNHVKGICFTGTFDANGAGSALSTARMFASGKYPVVGRLNLGTADPNAHDSAVRVRGLGLRIATPDGQEWRSAMIDPPVFAVSSPQGFYDLQKASHNPDPAAMKAFVASHPEFKAFGAWAKSAPMLSSFAGTQFNSLDSFILSDASGRRHAVRWSFVPMQPGVPLAPGDLAQAAPDFLDQEITDRVAKGPVQWTMRLTVANPGDQTKDPSQAWPAGRQTIDAGTLTVTTIVAEDNGPCRDIVFDPTILPSGIAVSDDPFPAARSAAYQVSFDKRAAEAKAYPARQGAAQ